MAQIFLDPQWFQIFNTVVAGFIFLFVFVVVRNDKPAFGQSPLQERIILLGLLVVALYLRIRGIENVYDGQLSIDENQVSIEFVGEQRDRLLVHHGAGRLVQMLSVSTLFSLFGFDPVKARFVPLIFGIFGLYVLYRLIKKILGEREALWTTVAMALSINAIHLSRIALEIGLVFFFGPLAILGIEKALRSKSLVWSALAGVIFGVSIFTYGGFLIGFASLSLAAVIIYLRQNSLTKENALKTLVFGLFVVGPVLLAKWWNPFALVDMKGGGYWSATEFWEHTKVLIRDVFVTADSWYLQQTAMPFVERALIPFALFSLYLEEKEKRKIAQTLWLTLIILFLATASTGIYYGARRMVFGLIVFYVLAGLGLVGLLKRTNHKNKNSILMVTLLPFLISCLYSAGLARNAELDTYGSGFTRERVPDEYILEKLNQGDLFVSEQDIGGVETSFDKRYYRSFVSLAKRYGLIQPQNTEIFYLSSANIPASILNFELPEVKILTASPLLATKLVNEYKYCLSDKMEKEFGAQSYLMTLSFTPTHKTQKGICPMLTPKLFEVSSKVEFCRDCFLSFMKANVNCDSFECFFPFEKGLYTSGGRLSFFLKVPKNRNKNIYLRMMASKVYNEEALSKVFIYDKELTSLTQRGEYLEKIPSELYEAQKTLMISIETPEGLQGWAIESAELTADSE